MKIQQTYPDCYLHVLECRSGETWIVPIGDNDLIDLQTNIDKWVQSQFSGELVLDPPLMPKLDGDYYAKVMTDGRPPDSVVCWQGAGFFLKPSNTNNQ